MLVRKLAISMAAALGMLTLAASAGAHDPDDVRAEGAAARAQALERVRWSDASSSGDPLVRIKLLGINDFHGQLSAGRLVAGRPVGSAAVLASYLKAAAANAL